MNATEARDTLAAALTGALDGYVVAARPTAGGVHPRKGWVQLGITERSDGFRGFNLTLTAIIPLTLREDQADELYEQVLLPALAALDPLPFFAVSASPEALLTGGANAPVFALTITATTEVQ